MTQRKRELLGFTSRSPLEFIDILDKFASDITKEEELQQFVKESNYEMLREYCKLRNDDYIKGEEDEEINMYIEKAIVSIVETLGKESILSIRSDPNLQWLFKSVFYYKKLSEEGMVNKLKLLTMIFVFVDDLSFISEDDVERIILSLFEIAKEYHDEIEENITPFSVVCLLAISKHFPQLKTNPVISLLLSPLFNDLSIVFVSVLNQSNSIHLLNSLSFFRLIFSDYNTANAFYINDLRVIIDVILREVIDLTEGDYLRSKYLEVIFQILLNCTDYLSILYRHKEIESALITVTKSESMDLESYSVANKILTKCKFIFDLTTPLDGDE